MTWSWWCSAQNTAWTWTWQAYPGVWLFVGALIAAYAWSLERYRPAGEQVPRGRRVSYGAGAALLWLAADWPIGALGAGYLASVHTVQYLVFALVGPLLLLNGLPAWALRAPLRRPWALAAARFVSRPLVAFAIFNAVMLGTHLPGVVDTLRVSQLGSFALDMLWLGSGFVFWWPVLGPLPELEPMGYPGRLVYLVANIFIPTVPAAFLTFADYPIYGVYELAPRVGSLSAREDQQLAGLAMKIVGGFVIFGAASALFFRWYRDEQQSEPPDGAA